MKISLRLNGSFIVTAPQISVSGPTATQITYLSATDFISTLNTEGTYTFTASAVGPDGQTYQTSTTVTVLSRYLLQNLLQGKWEGIKSKLTAKDVEGAVSYLMTPAQADYRAGFSAFADKLPLLALDLPPIELVESTGNHAECLLLRQEMVLGKNKLIGYPIYFIKENAQWKLTNF